MSGDIKISGDVVAEFRAGVRHLRTAEVIQEAMRKHGIRNQDLIDICGTRARASEIVNGVRGVPKSMAVRLAKRLRVPLAKLIG